MVKFSILAAAGLIAFAPVSIAAQEAQQAESSAEAKENTQNESRQDERQEGETPKAKEKKVCKSIRSMGSRFSEKVCMTKSEWDAQREGTQDNIREKR